MHACKFPWHGIYNPWHSYFRQVIASYRKTSSIHNTQSCDRLPTQWLNSHICVNLNNTMTRHPIFEEEKIVCKNLTQGSSGMTTTSTHETAEYPKNKSKTVHQQFQQFCTSLKHVMLMQTQTCIQIQREFYSCELDYHTNCSGYHLLFHCECITAVDPFSSQETHCTFSLPSSLSLSPSLPHT